MSSHTLPTSVRKSVRFSKSQLTSTKILAQRSAVPAVFSRPASAPKRKAGVSYEEKARLLQIGKRAKRGPFNSVMDPSEFASGSSIVDISAAVKNSGGYDAWVESEASENEGEKDGFEPPKKPKVKVSPCAPARRYRS